MRGIKRCAAALVALVLLTGALALPASAMVYGSIDRYSGKTLNIHEDSTAYMTIGKQVRLRMRALIDRRMTPLSVRSFESSKPSVAYVTPSGWVKALGRGTTRITMTAKDGARYALTLTVVKSDAITALWFREGAVATTVGKRIDLGEYLEAKPLTALLSSNRVLWKSSNTKVALVDTTGVVTPRKPGTATVTATCGKYKATIKVRVKE